MRIAVIGTGISGNAAAYKLAQADIELVVYERDDRIGGHSATRTIDYDGVEMKVDTGFIVYNELNYPHFTNLINELGVETLESDMSFALTANQGQFEWCGQESDWKTVLNGLFAQRSNLFSWSYLKMLVEILRFQREARADLRNNRIGDITLGNYLQSRNFSRRLQQDYIIPMGAAIWSMSPKAMLDFPALSFFSFFENHRLLQWERPKWRTIRGGSIAYVQALTKTFADVIRCGQGVKTVETFGDQLRVTDHSGHAEMFDHVVIATHAPEALTMLKDATPLEREVLGAIHTTPNDVYLHRDPGFMPKRRAAWASWNFLRQNDETAPITLTYWMNRLQKLDMKRPLFVTLNPPEPPKAEHIFSHAVFHHPQMTREAMAAQKRLNEIQGCRNLWFCGAWTGFGFHEDGLKSGLSVAQALLTQYNMQGDETDLQAAQ